MQLITDSSAQRNRTINDRRNIHHPCIHCKNTFNLCLNDMLAFEFTALSRRATWRRQSILFTLKVLWFDWDSGFCAWHYQKHWFIFQFDPQPHHDDSSYHHDVVLMYYTVHRGCQKYKHIFICGIIQWKMCIHVCNPLYSDTFDIIFVDKEIWCITATHWSYLTVNHVRITSRYSADQFFIKVVFSRWRQQRLKTSLITPVPTNYFLNPFFKDDWKL